MAVSKAGYSKIILALLDEIITFYMQLTLINVWGPRFKNPL